MRGDIIGTFLTESRSQICFKLVGEPETTETELCAAQHL